MILCLETSAKACSVALSSKGKLLATREELGEMRHSQMVTLLVQDCLKELGATMNDLTAVAVSQGPGSYTGLRVGTSCAKGICYALDIPLISIPTLEVIAYPFLEGIAEDTVLVPMIDARRMEVYYNQYDYQLKALAETDNLVLDTEGVSHFSADTILFCGDGAHKMQDFLQASWHIQPSMALAKHMSVLAYNKLKSGLVEDIAYYVPYYLKPPNITKSKKSLF